MPRLMTTRFDRLIAALARTELSGRACNQFSRTTGDLRGNRVRRRNLRLYLGEMEAIGPRVLLIGEQSATAAAASPESRSSARP